MTDPTVPQRAGRSADPFGPHPAAPVLARLPLLPAAPAEGDAQRASGLADVLEEGVFLASRQLQRVDAATDRGRATRRAYELRARWRPTPHGVFAGVALARVVKGQADLRVNGGHRARSNPSAPWLTAVAAMLLDGADAGEILQQLRLTADGTAVHRGERWETQTQAANGQGTVRRATVRATAATDLILAACAPGAPTSAVLGLVASRWPQAPRATVLDTVAELVRHGFVHTDLLPADLAEDPVGHLLAALPAGHAACAPLSELRAALAAADAYAPGHPERLKALAMARDLADRICCVERPLVVDVAADACIGVPERLVADVTRAAGVLWRICPRHDPAAEFHRRFTERYGHHRHVPLLQAADPVIGIGTGHDAATEHAPERTTALNSLIVKAVATGSIEVELDAAAVTALTGDGTTQPPHTTEVYVRLVADDEPAAAQGAVLAVIVGAVPTAGSTLARFSSLLGHRHTEPTTGSAVIAELAVRPRSASARTVAPPRGFAKHRIPVGVGGSDERDLSLEDLLLVSDGERLMVWSARLDRQIVPVLYSRLSPVLLPPVARLLYILGHAGTSPWLAWSWGAAAGPFQPRVRHCGVILCPARWALPSQLIDAAVQSDRWSTELYRWRVETVPPPPTVVVTEDDDRQLPLTLDQDLDRELLRRYVRRGLTSVTEPPGGSPAVGAVATGAHGRHLIELVIPLIRNAPAHAPRSRPAPPARARGTGLFHPGGPWLSLAVPTAPHLQDEVLLRIADLANGLEEHWDHWFYLRYRTAALGHHLRVRFHGRPDALGGRVLPAVAHWAAAMNTQNLAGRMSVECYEQEIERYGGAGAIEAAEHVFAADSALALTLLPEDDEHRIVAAAQTAAAITRIVDDGRLDALDGRHLNRSARRAATRLRPRARTADAAYPDPAPGGKQRSAALHESLTAYRDALPPQLRAACVSSLIHMHANRVLTSADDEPLIRALAADLIARER